MGVRRSWLAALLLVLPCMAGADSHKTELYLGFSYAHESDLYGAQLAFAWRPWGGHGEGGKIERFSLVASEFGLHGGADQERERTWMAGVRATVFPKRSEGKDNGCEGHTPCTSRAGFVHVLFGYTATRKDGLEHEGSGFTFGAGHDWLPWKQRHCGLRLQGDVIVPVSGGGDAYWRLTTGFIFRPRYGHD